MAAENPFRIGSHVTGAFFTDRAAEVKRIAGALREPTRLLVFGPRRIGKSSAIAVATERARKDGVLVVRADLSTASGLVDVANRLLHSLSAQRVRERLAEFASSIAPSVSLMFDEVSGAPRIVFGTEQRSGSEDRQRRSLEQVIEGLARQVGKKERHIAVVLDEFQAIRRLGGDAGEWHLRDLIQRHAGLSFVCAGSEVSLIQEMLEPDRAFFRMFELLHVGPLDPDHLSRWIHSRLQSAGVESEGIGEEILRRVGPRTQDVLQVARHIYARGSGGRRIGPDAVDEAVADVVREEDPVIRAIWTNLTAQQQNVLRAVASGSEQIFSAASRARFGLPVSSSVATAVDAPEARGILVRDTASGAIAFDSPFVRVWVEREALQDVPPQP
jgi:uncharacterized protein